MAVNFKIANVSRGSTTYKCLPEEMEVDAELNGRHDLPSIEWLINSILNEGGQHTPVKARNNGGRPKLVSGFSRWRAITEINNRKLTPEPMEIQFIVLERANDLIGFLANLTENVRRNDLTVIDVAHNCHKLASWGLTPAQIAEHFPKAGGAEGEHQTASWVKARLKLYGATLEVQQAVKDGKLGVTAAAQISQLADSEQRKAAQTGKAPNSVKKVTLLDVKILLGKAVNDGVYPEGVDSQTTAEDFCGILLDLIGGPVKSKANGSLHVDRPEVVAGEALAF